MRRFLAIAGAIVLAACNPVSQMNDADAQIEEFQAHYNNGDKNALFAMTGTELRDAVTREEWDGLVDYVSARLGAIGESSQSGINVNSNNGVTLTTITRNTSFANGDAVETYTFIGSGEDMRLFGWEVEGDALAVTPQPGPGAAGDTAPRKPGAVEELPVETLVEKPTG